MSSPQPQAVSAPAADFAPPGVADGVPGAPNPRILELVAGVSAARVEADVRTLAGFGTRHTLSDTLSSTRGIGAARRWIRSEFQRISADCGGCLEVQDVSATLPAGTDPRYPSAFDVVNPIAIQRGRTHPDRYVIMTAHYDSRVNDIADTESDAPGANDNASGVAGVLEVARLLSRHPTEITIVYAALAGEEQGLFGAGILADHAAQNGWGIEAVINNDMIGNSRGISGDIDNTTVRVFAPGLSAAMLEQGVGRLLTAGGELDLPSRQLARRVMRAADLYVSGLDVLMIYRLDRFGRSGDHRPFFERGHPAIRITETHEDFRRQHQRVRVEEGVEYGDLPDPMDFRYLAKIAALNAAAIASIAWAPPAPESVTLSGAVTASTRLRWTGVEGGRTAGYRIYWRRPTEPQWTHSRPVGNVSEAVLDDVSIDNYFFGVAAVDEEGNESLVRAAL